jgi:hypothetical protein
MMRMHPSLARTWEPETNTMNHQSILLGRQRLRSLGIALLLLLALFAGQNSGQQVLAQPTGANATASAVLTPTTSVAPGGAITGTATYTNTGPEAFTAQVQLVIQGVADPGPPTCSASGGASCPSFSGNSPYPDSGWITTSAGFNFPAGGQIVFTYLDNASTAGLSEVFLSA